MKLSIEDMWAIIRNDSRGAKELAVEFYDTLIAHGGKVSGDAAIAIERYRQELRDWEKI